MRGLGFVRLALSLAALGACGTGAKGAAGGGDSGTDAASAAPTAIAAGQPAPMAIAVDDTFVYWTNAGTSPSFADGAVMKAPKGASGPAQMLATGPAAGVAQQGDHVYWTATSGNAVSALPKAGGTPFALALSMPGLGPLPIAADPMGVVWGDMGAGGAVQGAELVSLASPSMLAGGTGSVIAVALDPAYVYWLDEFTQNDEGEVGAGAVQRVLRSGADAGDGGAGELLVANELLPYAIVADSTALYWVAAGASSVRAADLDGSNPRTLATGVTGAYNLAIDDTSLYWTTTLPAAASPSGAVWKMPKAGGPVTLLVDGQENPWGLAVDATSVYWVNRGTRSDGGPSFDQGDGRVMRAPKG